jgi:hypothetical protein
MQTTKRLLTNFSKLITGRFGEFAEGPAADVGSRDFRFWLQEIAMGKHVPTH